MYGLRKNHPVIPVLSPEEMRAVDAAAPHPLHVLVRSAAQALAREAVAMLGGTYGKRVFVLAGPGNNGADARVAAELLERRGVRTEIMAVSHSNDHSHDVVLPSRVPRCDLVIDGAFGTGFHGSFVAPDPGDALVLAVDLPSGLDGLTGVVNEGSAPMRADVTVTFAALKPGLLLGRGPQLAGRVVVADIGLDAAASARAGVIERSDVALHVGSRQRDAHKWDAAVLVIAGSPGMSGAPLLVSAGALRAGSGMVRLAVPGQMIPAGEAVGAAIPAEHWSGPALAVAQRCAAIVIGPGLGRVRTTRASIRQVLTRTALPVVVDADALAALAPGPNEEDPRAMVRALAGSGSVGGPPADRGPSADATGGDLLPGQRAVLQAAARRMGATPSSVAATGRAQSADLDAAIRGLAGRPAHSTVLTPHDGEFRMLTGHLPGADRFDAVRRLAAATGAVVLLKGPTTLVASPDGWVDVITVGDQRLATAGTGDVLAGVIGALLARGLTPQAAAACGAWLHGTAATRGLAAGLVAGDLPELVAGVLTELSEDHAGGDT